MPLNLSEINPGRGARLIEPRDIFAALPSKPWPRLRPEQDQVLKAWFDRRDETDLVIKQNTGGGKTLVGLLIGQSGLNEGAGPVAYLVPDSYLIQQVVGAANEVHIAVTTDAHDDRFLTGHAILVATFDKVVNGRSTFGVRGSGRSVTALGTVIVDDAHAALAAARHQFHPALPAATTGYGDLLKLFAPELQRQSPDGYADLVEGDFTAPLRVPPKATAERAQQALQILRKHGDDNTIKTFYFGWPFVADHLELAVITFTHRFVEIHTPCPHIDLIPAFAQARRRVYLTATLADEGVLVTDLAARPESVRRPITPDRASDLGDRIILAPQSINPSLDDVPVRQMVREFANGDRDGDGVPDADPVNVVVLVPSEYRAQAWKPYADQILNVKTMLPVIKRLADGEHIGVTVLINKYDGVDLPHAACRLLVVDGVPTPLSGSEQRESAALTGSMTFEARKVQRIEQGMGRGIRDLQDYCAVLLLTRDAALTLRDPRMRQFYSPVTREQIALSQKIADQIQNEGLDEIRRALNAFLQRDEQWITISRAAVADVEYDRNGKISDIAVARREAFDQAAAGNPQAAVGLLCNGINTVSDELDQGWLLEELAGYQQLCDPAEAQKTLAAARERNPGVIKPDVSATMKPIKGPALQAEAAANYLAQHYADPTTLRLRMRSLFDNVTWGVAETADHAEEQMKLLGLHLGFVSVRPEKEDNDGGPDNLWGLSPTINAVIELKTEISRADPTISKTEASQLLSSIEWDTKRNPHVTSRIPVLLHPSCEPDRRANLPPNTRIVTEGDLKALRTDVERFADELAANRSWANPTAVAEALQRNKLTADRIINAHSSKVSKAAG